MGGGVMIYRTLQNIFLDNNILQIVKFNHIIKKDSHMYVLFILPNTKLIDHISIIVHCTTIFIRSPVHVKYTSQYILKIITIR